MSDRKRKKSTLKTATGAARKMMKRLSKIKEKNSLLVTVVILAVGVSLGIAFDELELFLAIAVAINVIAIIKMSSD